jgi:hypothetical protein
MRYALLALVLALSFLPVTSRAAERGARFQNLDQMIEALNLRRYFNQTQRPTRPVRVAIFDNGFKDAEKEIGRSLPRNTVIVPGPVALQGEEEVHGFYMARILWSLLSLDGTDERYRPAEFRLYRTFGYSNFKAAIDDAIARKIDVILYSQTWDYGGNFDGRGFINQLVDKALDAGILWINSSGNTGTTTYNGAIEDGRDGWLKLPGRNDSVEIRCPKTPLGKCPLRAVLSWNDFKDDIALGSDKDLDFVLTDDALNIVQASSLRQVKTAEEANAPGTSQYPREIITAELKPGVYFLRVKKKSENFTARDALRISVQGDSLQMRNADRSETVLPPADNPRVIAVGASDTERASMSRRLRKPELKADSLVILSKQEQFKGTSNTAAMVAAGAAILKSIRPSLTREDFLAAVGQGANAGATVGRGLPLEVLGFAPTGRGCFKPLREDGAPDHVLYALSLGGRLVDTNAGAKVFYPFDPVSVVANVYRRQPNDLIVMTSEGPGVYHRSGLRQMPEGMIELVELPRGQRLCPSIEESTGPAWAKRFRLP